MQRRHVLVGIGSAALGAGCLDGVGRSLGDDGFDDPDEVTVTASKTTTTPTGTTGETTRPPAEPGPCPETLFPVRLLDRDDEEHRLSVTVTDAEGETGLDDQFVVEADTRGRGLGTGAEVRYRDSDTVDVAMDGDSVASKSSAGASTSSCTRRSRSDSGRYRTGVASDGGDGPTVVGHGPVELGSRTAWSAHTSATARHGAASPSATSSG